MASYTTYSVPTNSIDHIDPRHIAWCKITNSSIAMVFKSEEGATDKFYVRKVTFNGSNSPTYGPICLIMSVSSLPSNGGVIPRITTVSGDRLILTIHSGSNIHVYLIGMENGDNFYKITQDLTTIPTFNSTPTFGMHALTNTNNTAQALLMVAKNHTVNDTYKINASGDVLNITLDHTTTVVLGLIDENANSNRINVSKSFNGDNIYFHRNSLNPNSWEYVNFGSSANDPYAVTFNSTDNNYMVAIANTVNVRKSSDGVTWGNNISTGEIVYGLFSAFGLYIVLSGNTIKTSTDGITWTSRSNFPPVATIRGVFRLFNGLLLCSKEGFGENPLKTSTDGITWTDRTSQFGTSDIFDISYGKGLFVAVGEEGKISTSPTGETWTSRSSGTSNYLTSIAFDGKNFITIGTNFSVSSMHYSEDGITWAAWPTPPSLGGSFTKLIYNNGVYYFSSSTAALGMIVSTDLVNYNSITKYAGTTYASYSNNNDIWFTQNSGALLRNNKSMMSFNRKLMTGLSNQIAAIGYGAGNYIISGANGSIKLSQDLNTWGSAITTVDTNVINGFTYANSKFVCSVTSQNYVKVSTNGTSWSTQSTGGGAGVATNIFFGNNKYVLLLSNSTLRHSTDGISWTPETTGFVANDGIYANGLYVLVGGLGQIKTSTDLASWTTRVSEGSGEFHRIAYGNNTFVAVFEQSSTTGKIAYSADGISWTVITPSVVDNGVFSICFSDGHFIAGFRNGGLMSSIDGINWTLLPCNNYSSSYPSAFSVRTMFSYNGAVLFSPVNSDAALCIAGKSSKAVQVYSGMGTHVKDVHTFTPTAKNSESKLMPVDDTKYLNIDLSNSSSTKITVYNDSTPAQVINFKNNSDVIGDAIWLDEQHIFAIATNKELMQPVSVSGAYEARGELKCYVGKFNTGDNSWETSVNYPTTISTSDTFYLSTQQNNIHRIDNSNIAVITAKNATEGSPYQLQPTITIISI